MRHRMMLSMGALFIGMMALAAGAHPLPYLDNYGRHESGRSAGTENQTDMKRMELKRIHVKGTVERVTEQAAYIRTKPNETYVVELGPRAYWEEHHYRLAEGERVSVSGWNDPYLNSDMVFAGKISGKGFSIPLAERSGKPMWPTNFASERGQRMRYDAYETWYGPNYRYEPMATTEHGKTSSMRHSHSRHTSSRMEKKTESETNPSPSGASQ